MFKLDFKSKISSLPAPAVFHIQQVAKANAKNYKNTTQQIMMHKNQHRYRGKDCP